MLPRLLLYRLRLRGLLLYVLWLLSDPRPFVRPRRERIGSHSPLT